MIILLAATAGLAAVVSLLLFYGTRHALPGCGQQSGCADVLQTRWSRLGRIRVSGLAAGTYLIVAVAAALLSVTREPPTVRRGAIAVLAIAAPVMAISALWFLGIQAFVLRRFCTYCLVVHILGLASAALIFASSPPFSGLHSATFLATLAGVALVTLFIAGQLVLRPVTYQHSAVPHGDTPPTAAISPTTVDRLSAAATTASTRHVTLCHDRVHLSLAEWPILGAPTADHVVAFCFDYTCDSCRRMHGLLTAIIGEEPERYAVLLLPVPTEPSCNRYVTRRDAKHAHACAYARLALAVWLANPDQFQKFEEFMLQTERAPTLVAALQFGNRIVDGGGLYDPEVPDPDLDRRMHAAIELHRSLNQEKTPSLLLPDGVLRGEVSSVAELRRVLREHLHEGKPLGSV